MNGHCAAGFWVRSALFVFARAGTVAVLALILAVASGTAWAMQFKRTDTGQSVAPNQLLQTLAQSGVTAHLAKDETLSLLDAEVSARTSAVLYIAISSETRIVAVLEGEALLVADGQVVEVGQVMVWPIASADAEVTGFDIDRFLATSSLTLPKSTRASLQAASEIQHKRVFWGALRRTDRNAQSPVPPLVEAMRRDILLRPAVVNLRHDAGGNQEVMARMAVDGFIAALRSRDVSTVRDLLAPSLFRPSERTPSAWLAVRHNLAGSLVDSPLGRRLASSKVVSGDLESGFRAKTRSGKMLHIKMLQEHGFPFVGEISPGARQ